MMKIPVRWMKLNDVKIRVIPNDITTKEVIRTVVNAGKQDDAFYIMDVGDVVRKHQLWQKSFPNVKPFYAVKCNHSTGLLRIFNTLGTGFDCASMGEISRVLSLGVPADRILFANPNKPSSHIKYAAKVGVAMMTFDNEPELLKIKEYHPEAKLILRIRCDAKDVQYPFGMKFGVEPGSSVAKGLISQALNLGLELVGVSFHVGSDCCDPSAFADGVRLAADVMAEMKYQGAEPYILDIGGGFTEASFHEVSTLVNEALDDCAQGLTVIAEPGRFYVYSAFTLATAIHGVRGAEYYINDGVFGSFNCVLSYNTVPSPSPLKDSGGELSSFKIWGPSLDARDLISENALLPLLKIGDWLVWENMGAYTVAIASIFNGFPVPDILYVASEENWKYLEEISDETSSCDSADSLENDGFHWFSPS